jgi:hypothetical protein
VALCGYWLSLKETSEAIRYAREARRIAREHGYEHQLALLGQLVSRYRLD